VWWRLWSLLTRCRFVVLLLSLVSGSVLCLCMGLAEGLVATGAAIYGCSVDIYFQTPDYGSLMDISILFIGSIYVSRPFRSFLLGCFHCVCYGIYVSESIFRVQDMLCKAWSVFVVACSICTSFVALSDRASCLFYAVRATLRPTRRPVGQSVLVSSPIWVSWPDINYCWHLLFCRCRAPPLTRGRVCHLS
jgi:hypothetical protein